jgi:hypothetical protein
VAAIGARRHTLDLTRLPVQAQRDTAEAAGKLAGSGAAEGEVDWVPASDIARATARSGSTSSGAAADLLPSLLARLRGGSAARPVLVMGRVTGASGAGVTLHLGGRLHGRAALTDLNDVWVDNALEGVKVRLWGRLPDGWPLWGWEAGYFSCCTAH